MILRSNYDEIDFNELYKAQRKVCSFTPKTKDDWDKKAIKFAQGALNSEYANDFLRLVDFSGADSVLDFACGAGAISLKVANRVKQVYACDYSPKMLEYLCEHSRNLKLDNIKTIQKAFDDDWCDLPECDLVFASCCLEVDDPKACIQKLLLKTKKRLYITFKVENSFVDNEILEILQRSVIPKPNYIYIVNIIAQLGFEPCLNFINAKSCHSVDSEDELIKKLSWELASDISDDEKQRLISYYKNGGKAYAKPTKWAFVSINKEQ